MFPESNLAKRRFSLLSLGFSAPEQPSRPARPVVDEPQNDRLDRRRR